MGSYSKDSSSLQVADYAGLIWHANISILDAIKFRNTDVIPESVDFLETLLCPFADERYRTDKAIIDAIKPEPGATPNEIKRNHATANAKKVLETHRALMRLAYRKKFLPAYGSGSYSGGNDDGFVLGGDS